MQTTNETGTKQFWNCFVSVKTERSGRDSPWLRKRFKTALLQFHFVVRSV